MKNVRRTGIAVGLTTAFAAFSFAALSPSAASAATATPVTVPFFTVVTTTTNVYDTPSTSGDLEGQLFAGQTWFVLGTDATGSWVQVQIPSDSGLPSWVPANTLQLTGVTLPLSGLVTPATVAATTAAPASATIAATATAAATTNTSSATANGSATIAVPFLTTVVTTTNVYDAPSTSGDVAGQVTAGQTWFVLGTDSTGQWIHLQIPSDNGLQSWVPANTVAVQGLIIPQG